MIHRRVWVKVSLCKPIGSTFHGGRKQTRTVATMNNKSARGQTNCNTKLRGSAGGWTCARFLTFISPASVIYVHRRSSRSLSLSIRQSARITNSVSLESFPLFFLIFWVKPWPIDQNRTMTRRTSCSFLPHFLSRPVLILIEADSIECCSRSGDSDRSYSRAENFRVPLLVLTLKKIYIHRGHVCIKLLYILLYHCWYMHKMHKNMYYIAESLFHRRRLKGCINYIVIYIAILLLLLYC